MTCVSALACIITILVAATLGTILATMLAASVVRLAMPRQTADTHDDAPQGDATVEAADRHAKRVSRNSKFSCEIPLLIA